MIFLEIMILPLKHDNPLLFTMIIIFFKIMSTRITFKDGPVTCRFCEKGGSVGIIKEVDGNGSSHEAPTKLHTLEAGALSSLEVDLRPDDLATAPGYQQMVSPVFARRSLGEPSRTQRRVRCVLGLSLVEAHHT